MTDQELQLALAKMLPDKIEIVNQGHGLDPQVCFFWRDGQGRQIVDESWLHACWLVEKTLSSWEEISLYRDALCIASGRNPNYWMYGEPKIFPAADFVPVCCSSWQQRAEALCKVKDAVKPA